MDNRIDAIYGRQSIDKKDSISIESQFEFCRYELKGGEGKEYKDKGYSGKNIERPDFQRLLQDIRLGLIKRVIVYKLDRISRSIVDFAKLMELFKQYDVEFVSCTEKFDTSTPMGRATMWSLFPVRKNLILPPRWAGRCSISALSLPSLNVRASRCVCRTLSIPGVPKAMVLCDDIHLDLTSCIPLKTDMHFLCTGMIQF